MLKQNGVPELFYSYDSTGVELPLILYNFSWLSNQSVNPQHILKWKAEEGRRPKRADGWRRRTAEEGERPKKIFIGFALLDPFFLLCSFSNFEPSRLCVYCDSMRSHITMHLLPLFYVCQMDSLASTMKAAVLFRSSLSLANKCILS